MQRVIKLFQQIGLFFGLVYLNMKRFALSFDMLSRSSVFNGNTGYKTLFSCFFLDVKSLCVSGTREQPVQIQSIILKSTAVLMNNPFMLQPYDSATHDKCMSVCALCSICFKRLTPV